MSSNLVLDPGFVNGTSGFAAQSSSDSCVQTATDPISGPTSLEISLHSWGSNVWWDLSAYGTDLVNATQLIVSAQIRGDVTASGTQLELCADIDYTTTSTTTEVCSPASTVEGVVETVTAIATADPTQTVGSFSLRLTQNGSTPITYAIDNASVVAVFGHEQPLPPLPNPVPTGTCSTVGSTTGLPYCPFASTSTWNQELPASPAVNTNSATQVSSIFQNYDGVFYLNQPGVPGAFPHYFTHAGDPTVTIDLTLPYGSSNLQHATVPIPVNAVPAAPTDAHMTVLDATTGNEYDYYQFPQNQAITQGETISLGFGNIVNYFTGDGWGGATTAAGAPLLAGLVTVDEFESGVIHHALAMAPGCNASGSVYPATASASSPCTAGGNVNIPLGGRIWSDLTDAQVDAMNMDVISTMILKALNHYGGFVTDTNGWKALDIRNLMESPVSPEGQVWWNQNGGDNPAIDNQPVSFWTTHLHVLQTCVSQGSC